MAGQEGHASNGQHDWMAGPCRRSVGGATRPQRAERKEARRDTGSDGKHITSTAQAFW